IQAAGRHYAGTFSSCRLLGYATRRHRVNAGIRKVAVLGAGTMGARIAAHLANAGVPCYLLDIRPAELTAEEAGRKLTADSPEVRNRIVRAGFEAAKKA